MIWSLSRLNLYVGKATLDLLCEDFFWKIPKTSIHSLCMILHVFSQTKWKLLPGFMNQIVLEIFKSIHQAKPKELSTIVASVGEIGATLDESSLILWMQKFDQQMESFEPFYLSESVNGLAQMNVEVSKELLNRVVNCVKLRQNEFTAQHLAMTVWALRTLNYQFNERELNIVLTPFLKLGFHSLKPSLLCAFGKVIATMESPLSNVVYEKWYQQFVQSIHKLDSIGISNSVWSLSKTNRTLCSNALMKIQNRFLKIRSEFNAEQLLQLMRGIQILRIDPEKDGVVKKYSERNQQHLSEFDQVWLELCREVLNQFELRHLAEYLRILKRMGVKLNEKEQKILLKVIQKYCDRKNSSVFPRELNLIQYVIISLDEMNCRKLSKPLKIATNYDPSSKKNAIMRKRNHTKTKSNRSHSPTQHEPLASEPLSDPVD
eukprot:CAMPEP_0182442804 /NCGR_PEP_ID=MMETSP1172-20130603/1673_1 /TAXON_ID=708627 /ORGANISM="Timspurckia oligopyrenoides, Strain CCMP3278" /LENGTH=431 /DNA_ID=CAMNT_0024637835 /DNA_START=782 /DNA_END=2077 /DNA_ORIENTATION=-